MDCPGCGGLGCPHCGGQGRFGISKCPLEYAGKEVFEMLEYADLYQQGLPPVQGGALDQTRSFTEFCRFTWSEERYWKNKLGILW